MLDSSIMNAMAPEVRERFIQRLRHLEKLQAEVEFEAWQAKRRGPNLRQWRSIHEAPPGELTEWAKHLLAKSKTRQERMEEARKNTYLNEQCKRSDSARQQKLDRQARTRARRLKKAEEKYAEEMRSANAGLAPAEVEQQNTRRREHLHERREKKQRKEHDDLYWARIRLAKEAAHYASEAEWKEHRKAYLAELNAKAARYFAWKLERPEPEAPVTIYGLCGGPSYLAPRSDTEEQWDAYWRLGNRLASTGRDELPSEWIHAHREDRDEAWWSAADMTPK